MEPNNLEAQCFKCKKYYGPESGELMFFGKWYVTCFTCEGELDNTVFRRITLFPGTHEEVVYFIEDSKIDYSEVETMFSKNKNATISKNLYFEHYVASRIEAGLMASQRVYILDELSTALNKV